VVSVDLNGILHDVGTDIAAVLESDPVLVQMADTEQQEADIEKQVLDAVNKEERKDGKLILAEKIVEGKITWKASNFTWIILPEIIPSYSR
jgi:translation elongation factor EF-Ts